MADHAEALAERLILHLQEHTGLPRHTVLAVLDAIEAFWAARPNCRRLVQELGDDDE